MNRTIDMFDTHLFARPRIARRKDPATSKKAEAVYSKTKRGNDCQLMYDLILEHPGHTATEYSRLLRERGMEPYRADRMPSRRISDLRKTGRVMLGKPRKCQETGHDARTYYAIPD